MEQTLGVYPLTIITTTTTTATKLVPYHRLMVILLFYIIVQGDVQYRITLAISKRIFKHARR